MSQRTSPRKPLGPDAGPGGPSPVTKSPRKARTPSGADSPAHRKGRPKWRSFLHIVLVAVSVICGLGLVVSSYGGCLSPLKYGGYWGIAVLAMPLTLGAVLLMLLLQLFIWRRGALVPLLFLVICGGPVLDYFPLHVFSPSAPKGARTLKVLSYNVYNFTDFRPGESENSPRNRTLNTIIESGADIVCLQETEVLGPYGDNKIHREDIALLHKIYPYVIRTDTYLTLLSKYPVTPIHLEVNRRNFGADIGAYRVHLGEDMDVTVFNFHLASLGLTSGDFALYRDLTDGKTRRVDEMREVKREVLSKVAAANVERARQAEKLVRYIEHYGGPNVLVCGDFNDVSNCYAIRRFEELGLREVYPEVGFGPIVTYNARRLYFGIDHILYRGAFRPLSLKKGHVASSDHYPVTTVFELTDK